MGECLFLFHLRSTWELIRKGSLRYQICTSTYQICRVHLGYFAVEWYALNARSLLFGKTCSMTEEQSAMYGIYFSSSVALKRNIVPTIKGWQAAAAGNFPLSATATAEMLHLFPINEQQQQQMTGSIVPFLRHDYTMKSILEKLLVCISFPPIAKKENCVN